MLAQRKRVPLEFFAMFNDKCLPLVHQLQAEGLHLLQADRKVNIFKYLILQFAWKASYLLILLRPCHLPPPLLLLAWNMGGANDFDIGIDEEERHDLAMSRFGGVGELEWADAVLQDIGECEQAPFASLDTSDLLYSWAFVLASKHL